MVVLEEWDGGMKVGLKEGKERMMGDDERRTRRKWERTMEDK